MHFLSVSGDGSRRWPLLVKGGLLLALLTAHFLLRERAARSILLGERSIYPWSYRVSLSLLAGNGFHTFRLSAAPESQPVAAFLNLQAPSIRRSAWKAFCQGPDAQPVTCPPKGLETRLPTPDVE